MFKHMTISVIKNSVAFSPEKGLREKAYQDKPGGMPQPVAEHSPRLQPVPSLSIGCIIEAFPFDEVDKSSPFAVAIQLAVQDLIDFH